MTSSRSMAAGDRKSTRLNSSHQIISYAVFCLKKTKHQAFEVLLIAWVLRRTVRRMPGPHPLSQRLRVADLTLMLEKGADLRLLILFFNQRYPSYFCTLPPHPALPI